MTLLDLLTADQQAAGKSAADASAFKVADDARNAAKATSDASASAASDAHKAANAKADPGVLYALNGGVFAINIDGDVKYLTPADPAAVAADPA